MDEILVVEVAELETNTEKANASSDDAMGAKKNLPSTTKKSKPKFQKTKNPDIEKGLRVLAQHFPHLFGTTIKPLKRGIFDDIMKAAPSAINESLLKEVLAHHTRSTRYLSTVAEGLPRFDLTGNEVEKMAPEHIYYALQEVFVRRKGRAANSPSKAASDSNFNHSLIAQIVRLFDESGLRKEEFDQKLRNKNAAQNEILDEAIETINRRQAKDQALLRTFQASKLSSIEEFADIYGMHPKIVELSIQRAQGDN